MTEQSQLSDAQVRRLLEYRARGADPSGLVDAISTEIAGKSQRPAPTQARAVGWAAGAAAAAVIVLAITALLLRGPSGPGGPQVTMSPTPSPSPRAATESPDASAGATSGQVLGPAGLDAPPLTAGTWSTVAFQPGVTFAAPADRWSAGLDLPQQLFLRARLPGAPDDEFNATTIVRIEDVYADPCGLGSGGGTRSWTETADTFLGWLQEESPVDLGPVSTVTVLGAPARRIELEVPPDAYSECAEGYLPIGPIAGGASGQIAIPMIGQRFRMAALEVEGQTLLVITFGSPERWDALVAATDQLLATVQLD